MHYTTLEDVTQYLGVAEGDIDPVQLTKAIERAELDIDAAVGSWVPFGDTGLKFASDAKDPGLSDGQKLLLSRATAQQVEYRFTVGEDFMVRDQYEAESSPDGGVTGKVKKVSPHAYATLASAGLLRLNTGRVTRYDQIRRSTLPLA